MLSACLATNKTTQKASHMKKFKYNNVEISYTDTGKGKPILLIHGFGASSYSWRYIVDNYREYYRIINIDLKGFGCSQKPKDNLYSIKDQSEIVSSLIEHLDLQSAIIIGHSFGGAVSLYTAIESKVKHRFSHLILLDSASYKQTFPYFISTLRIPIINKLSLSLLPAKLNTKEILKKGFYDDSKITETMIQEYSKHLNKPGAHHALIETAKQIIPPDIDLITQKYKKITIPTLIIWGEQDEIVPLELGKRLNLDIPDSTLKIISNCGHIPHEECPEKTLSVLDDFLQNAQGATE